MALLLNMVAPSRTRLYEDLARSFRLTVLYGGREDNRGLWPPPVIRGAATKRARGLIIRLTRRAVQGGVWETNYLHVTPGYLADLWRVRPDAVITNEMGFRTLASLVYGTVRSRPVWVWWGGTLHTERGVGRLRRLARWLIARWARHWISYGRSSTEYLESIGVRQTRILQVQNSIDEQAYRPDGPRALELEPKPVVLHVGRMVERKGIGHLLKACAAVQGRGIRFSLVLLGDGPERGAIERRVKELRLQHVHVLPEVAPREMPSIYRSADLVVFPTLLDQWGLVVNEALWSGVPVLASQYAGCATELLPTESLFDPRDSAEFSAKLTHAITQGLPRPDTSRLWTSGAVAAAIADDVRQALKARGAACA